VDLLAAGGLAGKVDQQVARTVCGLALDADHARLELVGVGLDAVARCARGYLPFFFDVTDDLRATGANDLVVSANNGDNPITGPKPPKQLDYIQHGGI